MEQMHISNIVISVFAIIVSSAMYYAFFLVQFSLLILHMFPWPFSIFLLVLLLLLRSIVLYKGGRYVVTSLHPFHAAQLE